MVIRGGREADVPLIEQKCWGNLKKNKIASNDS